MCFLFYLFCTEINTLYVQQAHVQKRYSSKSNKYSCKSINQVHSVYNHNQFSLFIFHSVTFLSKHSTILYSNVWRRLIGSVVWHRKWGGGGKHPMVVMTAEDVFSQKTLYIDVGGTVTLLASGLAWPGQLLDAKDLLLMPSLCSQI